jgi:hypothetical protein
MRIFGVVVVAVVLGLQVTSAQDAQSMVRKNIQAREAALRSGDEQAWARLTTDDFMTITADGVVRNKAQRMAEIKGNKANLAATSDERVRVYGDTAMRTFKSPSNFMSELWVRQGGEWKVAHVQATALSKK